MQFTFPRVIVVHRKSRSAQATGAVASGVEAIDLQRFVASLGVNRGPELAERHGLREIDIF